MTTGTAGRLRVGKLKFPHSERAFSFRCVGLQLQPGDPCIVRTREGGEAFAEVRTIPGPLPLGSGCTGCMPRVVRRATDEDVRQRAEAERTERHAHAFCREKITSRALPMKLLYVEKPFDQNRLVFHFHAEHRVDFRELVKDMAHAYRARIEMRQDGVRDFAATQGGLGSCGKELCCSTHLDRFAPVSIKMAKQQDLPLNPESVTGQCGRLKCCLRYEYDPTQAPTRGRRGRKRPRTEAQTFDA